MSTPSRPRLMLVVSTMLILGLSACSGGRPTFAEWLPFWTHTIGSIPGEDFVSSDTSQEVCEQTLADLRIHQGSLLPTPDEAIDATVRDWIDVAEQVFFECPPIGGFSDSFAELRRLEAEIDVVIELDLNR